MLAVAVVVAVTAGMTKSKKDIGVVPTDNSIDICYIWNTEAGDSASLRMSFLGSQGSEVIGSLTLEPAEKDKTSGPFSGTVGPVDPSSMNRTAKVMWQSSGEGMTNQQELYINFGDGIATPGFGEMKDNGQGVYVYANPENLSYPINFQQTDCSDPALK